MSSDAASAQGAESEPLARASEVLFRQIHPVQYPNGKLASTAFVPQKGHEGMLSTHRERIGPEESFRRWTEDNKRDSVGTFGVSVSEARAAELEAIDDEVALGVPDHASVDFNVIPPSDGRGEPSKGQMTRAGRKLRDHADQRGCLHPAES